MPKTPSNSLNEDMSLAQAANFLRQNGVDPEKLDDRRFRTALLGKPQGTVQGLITAYKMVKSNQPAAGKAKSVDWNSAAGAENQPPWAEGLRDWAIRKQDYTDANFIRQKMWELSGKPTKNPLSLWTWDGERFSNHIVLLARTGLHKEFARAMAKYTRGQAKAVFMKGQTNNILLIYLDGRILNSPVQFECRSSNPNNDWKFIGELPRALNDITRKFEGSEFAEAKDYKAWVNVETNKIKAFDPSRSYYDGIRENPEMMSYNGKNLLHVRIAAERDGWVAVGVNSSDNGVGAVVTALNAQQALKAARMLFKARYKHGDWTSLRVKTNDTVRTFTGRREIRDYLLSKPSKGTEYLDT